MSRNTIINGQHEIKLEASQHLLLNSKDWIEGDATHSQSGAYVT